MPVRGKTNEVETPEIETNQGEDTKIVKKSPLEEKVKKFLSDIDGDVLGKVHETLERVVNSEGEKNNVLFMRFSDDLENDEVNDEVNVEVMKSILFHYHTAPEKIQGGKAMVVEIVPQTDDEPYTICFYEVS